MGKFRKPICTICTLCLLVMFLCPTSVFASTKASYEAQQDIDTVRSYTTIYADGRASFDYERAKANQEPEEILEIGTLVEEFADAYYNASLGIVLAVELPVYGNWCGPGYGEGNGAPIDALDAACMEHDKCYERTHYNKCDQALVDTINSKIQYMSGKQLNTAKAIIFVFDEILPCRN